MNYILVRVDNRLVHGQILEAWLPFIGVAYIVVVDDEVAMDFFRETVIKMAVPREIELNVYGLEDFTQVLAAENEKVDTKKALVLFSTIQSALRSYQSGFRFRKLNIGNVYNDDAKLRCAASIQLSEQDIADIRILIDMGVEVECRCVPKDKPLDMKEFLMENR